MLGIVFLWIVIYITGLLFCKIGREKETSQLWIHLTGFFFLFFCQGMVFFGGQMLGFGFEKTCHILILVLTIFSLLGVFIGRKDLVRLVEKIKGFRFSQMKYGRYKALFLWLFLGMALTISFRTVGNRNDAIVETVNRTLMTDTMYQYHPFTGQFMEEGMILSRKIITLPLWYGALSLWTGLPAVSMVCGLGSILTVGFSLMAYGELAGLLFSRDFKKTWLTVILLELLYLSGDYTMEAVGYRQLFYGYAGETILTTVTLPVVLCVLYRLFGPLLREDFDKEKEGITLWGALVKLGLCFAVTLFLTSVVWGFIILIIAIALFVICTVGICFMKAAIRHREE